MHRRTFLRTAGRLSSVGLLSTILPRAAFGLERAEWHERMEPLMGSFVGVAVFDADGARASRQLSLCFDFMRARIAEISSWNPESTTSRLNECRELGIEECAPSFLRLLSVMERLKAPLAPGFNALSGHLTSLWRRARESEQMPAAGEVRELLRDARRTHLECSTSKVKLAGGAKLEFGGIGKGFIADLAAEFLASTGATLARIDCGGDMRFLGDVKWQIDIEHPRRDGLLGSTAVFGSVGVATSGDYRNYVEIEEQRIHHLINMQDGFPSSFAQSTTVIAPTAVMADALASAFSVIPVAESLRRAEGMQGVEVLIVDGTCSIHRTSGFPFIRQRGV